MTTTTENIKGVEKHHLFVLFQHGSHGHYGQFFNLQQVLRSQFYEKRPSQDFSLTLWGTDVNRGKNTDAGTIACGEKLVKELVPAMTQWEQECKKENQECTNRFYFSCVGHSFGGIILRETLPQMLSGLDPHLTLDLVTFLTVASPHCGVRDIKDAYFATPPLPEGKKKPGFISRAWKSTKGSVMQAGGRFLGAMYSQSYQDLFCDNEVLSEKRLFSDAYLSVIRNFKSRHLFGNVHADKKVSFHTSTLHTLSLSNEQAVPPSAVCNTPHALPAQVCKGQPYASNAVVLNNYPEVIRTNFEFVVKQRTELGLEVPHEQQKLADRFLEAVGSVHVHPVVHHAAPNSKVKAHTFITGQVPGAAAKLQDAVEKQSDSKGQEIDASESEDEATKTEEQQVSSQLKTEYEALIKSGKGVTKASLRGSGMVDVASVMAQIILEDFINRCL